MLLVRIGTLFNVPSRRHLVVNSFPKIKDIRGVATRYDKTDTSYCVNLNLVATVTALC